MSVRDGMLALLSLGPAYGLQLHNEFAARTPHRGPVNVGQAYATLDRLRKQGLIETSGETDDGLPLNVLTTTGKLAVRSWTTEAVTSDLPEFTEMLDQVIILSTVDPAAALDIVGQFRSWWQLDQSVTVERLEDSPSPSERLALLARHAQSIAALAWLGSASAELVHLDTALPLSGTKPRRGRPGRALAALADHLASP